MSRNTAAARDQRDAELADMLDAYGDPWLAGHLRRCLHGRQQDRLARHEGRREPMRQRCRKAACEGCRTRLRADWGRRSRRRWTGLQSTSEDASMVTIVLARCGSLTEVDDVVRVCRARFRNWRRNKAVGWTADGLVEVDGIAAADVSRLLPGRYDAMQYVPQVGRQVGWLWVPCLHMALYHPGMSRHEVEAMVARIWPGRGVVHVQPLRSDVVEDEAGGVVEYATKHEQVTELAHEVKPWPIEVRAAYWSWLCGRGAGLRPLRVEFAPVRAKRSERLVCHTRTELWGHIGNAPESVESPGAGLIAEGNWVRRNGAPNEHHGAGATSG